MHMEHGRRLSKGNSGDRLARLVTSPVCPAEDATKYASELRGLADKVASSAQARRESRFLRL